MAVIDLHLQCEPALVHSRLDILLYLTQGPKSLPGCDWTVISHLLQRSDGVRNVPQLHVKVPGIVQHCPQHEDCRVGEVDVKL